MQTILAGDVVYSKLLDDVRSVIQHEINQVRGFELPDSTDRTLLTVLEAAEILQVPPVEVHNCKERGLLTFYRLCGRIWLKKSEVLSLQKQQINFSGKEVSRES